MGVNDVCLRDKIVREGKLLIDRYVNRKIEIVRKVVR